MLLLMTSKSPRVNLNWNLGSLFLSQCVLEQSAAFLEELYMKHSGFHLILFQFSHLLALQKALQKLHKHLANTDILTESLTCTVPWFLLQFLFGEKSLACLHGILTKHSKIRVNDKIFFFSVLTHSRGALTVQETQFCYKHIILFKSHNSVWLVLPF